MVPKIAMGEQHDMIREQLAEGSKNGARDTRRIRDEHPVELKVRAREHEIIHGEVLDESNS